jgi:hypothetical protein
VEPASVGTEEWDVKGQLRNQAAGFDLLLDYLPLMGMFFFLIRIN